jgi:hypothetical protein
MACIHKKKSLQALYKIISTQQRKKNFIKKKLKFYI